VDKGVGKTRRHFGEPFVNSQEPKFLDDGAVDGGAPTRAAEKDMAASDAELAAVLESCFAHLEAGRSIQVEKLLAEHPAIAERLRACLASLELVEKQGEFFRSSPKVAGDTLPGVQLGDFRILQEVGRGGMGVVYEAEQVSLGRRVALKVLPFAGALDSRQLQRFRNEAHAAAQLHHTNIVPIHYVGSERGVHFYAMQFIEGQTLAKLISELRHQEGRPKDGGSPAPPQKSSVTPNDLPTKLEQEQTGPYRANALSATPIPGVSSTQSYTRPDFYRFAANLGIQGAEALAHAHQKGIIHRDIKPGNILVDMQGNLWISDFGLAYCQSHPGLTMTGDLVGTLRYMSPEQALAKRIVVDHRTDIYSLGLTLYELLTRRPAFPGRDKQEVLRQIAFEEPPRPRRLNKDIPHELETIVLKSTEKKPADRYASAQEMADDLRRFLEDKPIRARRASLWQRGRKWAIRHKGVVRASVAGLLLGIAGLITGLVLAHQFAEKPISAEQALQQKQQQAFDKIQAELKEGRRVTLLGETGEPGWYRWATTEGTEKVFQANDGAFAIQSWEFGLLELLPDPMHDSYRFSAEVRHDKGPEFASDMGVGIYFGYRNDPNGPSHSYYQLSFNDRVKHNVPNPRSGQLENVMQLMAQTHQEPRMVPFSSRIGRPCFFVPGRQVPNADPWRKLAVVVGSDSLDCFWEGNLIEHITNKQLEEEFLNHPIPGFVFQNWSTQNVSRKPLGIYVFRGAASFRSVIIEPLK
jgi:serine/threonine protein kinase